MTRCDCGNISQLSKIYNYLWFLVLNNCTLLCLLLTQRRVCLCLKKESPCSPVTIQFCETSIRHETCPIGMEWQLATATQTPLPSLSASLAIISKLLSTSCSNRLKRRKRLENHNFTYSHHLLGVKELKPDMGEKGLWVLLDLFEKERLCLLFQPPLPQDGVFTGLVTPLSWLLSTIQGMGRWFSTVNSLHSSTPLRACQGHKAGAGRLPINSASGRGGCWWAEPKLCSLWPSSSMCVALSIDGSDSP